MLDDERKKPKNIMADDPDVIVIKLPRFTFNSTFLRRIIMLLLVFVLLPALESTRWRYLPEQQDHMHDLHTLVLPPQGVQLPIQWGNLGQRMLRDGVIDEQSFRSSIGVLNAADEKLLTGTWQGPVTMTDQNSRLLLDLFWAFGLANKNDILEKGEMTDPKYGGAGGFASTGGWSLAQGNAMYHYSAHSYVMLTHSADSSSSGSSVSAMDQDQQILVDRVSRSIFRPCCGNSTHFPDCNHGMAMLGLLELLAANHAGEQQMYQIALSVNAYWFGPNYLDLATYFQEQGTSWENVDPKQLLSAQYSSAQGYQQTRKKIHSLPPSQQGGNCAA